MTLGHALALAQQEVVESLPGMIGLDTDAADLRTWGLTIFAQGCHFIYSRLALRRSGGAAQLSARRSAKIGIVTSGPSVPRDPDGKASDGLKSTRKVSHQRKRVFIRAAMRSRTARAVRHAPAVDANSGF
jgi:hypothetical protein